MSALFDHLVSIQSKCLADPKDKVALASLRLYSSAPYRNIIKRAMKDIDNLYNQNI